jgi:predicted XRE-type DNA-binding protein
VPAWTALENSSVSKRGQSIFADVRGPPDRPREEQRMKQTRGTKVTASSGNVFADLRLSNPGEALAKAELAHRIGQVIAARGLTQAAAARLLGLYQPKVSALVRGRLKGFSVGRLFRCLNALGQEIEIVVRPVPRPGRRAGTRVASD